MPYLSFRRCVLAICVVAPVAFLFSSRSKVESTSAPVFVPSITATKAVVDVLGTVDGNADPGDTLEYTITVNNIAAPGAGNDAAGVAVNDTIQNITTLVAGSTLVSPIAVNDTFASIGNVGINVPDGASDLIGNDINPGGGGSLTIVAPLPTTSAQGGNVTVNANGSFTYNPAPGFEGADTFTYTLGNGSGLTNTAIVTINVSGMFWFVNAAAGAGGDGRLGTPFNCFFNAAPGVGCFDDTTADQAADNIFLYTGAYIGGQTLLDNQRLIGQGATTALAGPGSITGITIPPFSNALPGTGGTNPTITTTVANTNAVNLGQGNTIRGLTIGNTTGSKLNATATVGTLTVGPVSPNPSDVILNGNGQALNLTGGGILAARFASISSTGGTAGINISGVSGALTAETVSMNGQTGDGITITNSTATVNINGGTVGNSDDPGGNAVEVNGSNGNVTIAAALTKTTAGKIVLVTNRTGNTVAFSGNISATNAVDNGIDVNTNTAGIVNFLGTTKTLTTGAGTGVNLATNGTGVINFTGGGLVINTTGGVGFNATGGAGAVTVQGTGNTINATTGPANTNTNTALNVSSTTIGALGLTFQAIHSGNNTAAADPANGIVLNTTGNLGGLTVTGTGTTDGSGGTIRSTTSSGVRLVSSNSLSLSNINLIGNGTAQTVAGSDASCGGNLRTGNNLSCVANLFLQTVTGVTLTNVDITNGGQQGINGSDVTTLAISNSNITGNGNEAFENGANFQNLKGTCTVTNTMVKDNAAYQWAMANVQNASTVNLSFTGTRTNNVFPTIDTSTTEFGKTTQTNTNTNQSFLFDSTAGVTGLNATINFTGVVFRNSLPGNSILLNPIATSGSLTGTTTNTSFDNTAGGVIIQAQNGMNTNYDVTNSEFNKVNLQSVLFAGANPFSGTLDGTATGNHIGEDQTGTNGQACEPLATSNCNGIQVNMIGGSGTINALINNNTIQQFGGNGMNITANGTSSPDVNVTITGNTIKNPAGLVARGISTNMGTTANANVDGCLDIGGAAGLANNITGTYEDPGVGVQLGIVTNVRFLSHHRMPGYAGSSTSVGDSTSQTGAFINGRNTLGGKVFTQRGGSGDYPGGVACTQPSAIATPARDRYDNVAWLDDPWSSLSSGQQLLFGSIPASTALTTNNATAVSGEATAEVRASAGEKVPANYLGSFVELANKIAEMISPTVYAQEPESGETVTVSAFTLPAGESVTVKFRVTVDAAPFASGVDNITNQATVSGTNFTNVLTNITSIPLDAEPDLIVTKTNSSTIIEPGEMIAYTLTYSNSGVANANGAPQHAGSVVLTETVPTNTTFNAGASTPGWGGGSCVNGAPAGTVCTLNVGAVNAGAAAGNAVFTVNLPALLPVSAVSVPNTSTISESPANANGTDRDTANNTAGDTDQIRGNWTGAVSTDWNVAGNWSNGLLPVVGNNISIPDVANAPAVTVADVTVGLLTLGDNLTIGAGRTLTANENVALNDKLVTGAGTLELGVDAGLTRTTGQVQLTLKKNFDQPDTFIYHVGTPGEYSPVDVMVTAGTGSLSVLAVDGPLPATTPPLSANRLQRFWTLTGTGITADVTFHYLQAEVVGNEIAYRTVRVTGTTATILPSQCPSGAFCINPAANTITARNLSSFSNWSATEVIPTGAEVSVAGRVTNIKGVGIGNVLLVLTDFAGNPRTTTSAADGTYRLDGVPAGQTYVLTSQLKGYRFTPQILAVDDNMEGINFIGTLNTRRSR